MVGLRPAKHSHQKETNRVTWVARLSYVQHWRPWEIDIPAKRSRSLGRDS